MTITAHYNLAKPDPAKNIDEEFLQLQQTLDQIDTALHDHGQSIAGKADEDHGHPISAVTGLPEALALKMPASQTFSLDSLTDVDGAAAASTGYLLVKTPTGWVPAAPGAALGDHEHPISKIIDLQAALDSKANTSTMATALDAKLDDSQLDTDGTFSANSATRIPSQSAVKTYVDAALNALRNGVATSFDTLAELATNFGNYLPLTGGAMTGLFTGRTSGMSMTQDGGAAPGSISVRASGTGDANLAGISFSNDAYSIKLGVRADGYFGLGGWSRAAWSWYSDAAGNVVAAGNITAYSDPRLKDDVERIGGALNIIEALDGVRFTWNGKTSLIGRPGARDIGVLADQVQAVLPELVALSVPDEENGGERWRTVAYDKLVPVLIEAVKELSARVKELEGR